MRSYGWHERNLVLSLLLGVTLAFAGAASAAPLGTEFTYQGSLESSGSPVDGTVDFQFKLFNALTGGSQVGVTVPVNAAPVAGGVFTVSLDFGPGAFDGNGRWLEIAVRNPSGGGAFVVLSPRQEMTAAPYALKVAGVDGHSLDAVDTSPVDAVFVDASGNVGIGTLTPASRLQIESQANVSLVETRAGSGNNANFSMAKTGPLSPTNVGFTLSHRAPGTDCWMYGYDGTTFRNFQTWDFAGNQVRSRSRERRSRST